MSQINNPGGGGGGVGPPGPPGATGATGATGPAGPVVYLYDPPVDGEPGPPGPAGPAGSTGPAGVPGSPGVDGLSMFFLDTPLDGEPGMPGPPGPPGVDGAAGPTGPAGVAGSNGIDGSGLFFLYDPQDGADGAPGQTGPTGATGATGATGPAIFFVGDEGPEGPSGPPGPPGAVGPAGVAGPTGSNGVDGPAIFLIGEEGPEGPMGMPGATGPAGATGSAGSPGIQGNPGPNIILPSDVEYFEQPYQGVPSGAVNRASLTPDARNWVFLGTATAAAVTVGPVVWLGTYKQLMIRYWIAGYSGGTPVGRLLLGAASISTTALTNSWSLSEGVTAPTTAAGVTAVPGVPMAVTLSNVGRGGIAYVDGASGSIKSIEVIGRNQTPSVATAPTLFRAASFFSDLGTNLPIQRAQLTSYDTLTAVAVSANTFTAGTYLTVWGRNND